MAALSVQSAAGGIFSSMPRAAHTSSTRDRSSGVGRHAAPDRQPAVSRALQRLAQLDHQGLDHRPLVGRRQVGTPSERLLGAEIADLVDERRLQPAEAEVERGAASHPEREVEGARVALARQAVDRGAAGVAEAHQARAPCRAPRPRRRRGSSRAARIRRVARRSQAACAPRWRSGRGTVARAGPVRGSSPPRARAGGRPPRRADPQRRRAPSPWTDRPAGRRSGRAGWSRQPRPGPAARRRPRPALHPPPR